MKDPTLSSLDIADRDATDGYAEVRVPADWANAISVDLYMRVLGKPGGCIGADAFVFDGSTYFYAGTAVFKRKTGQSSFVNASELTDVFYCPDGSTVDPTTGHNYVCVADGWRHGVMRSNSTSSTPSSLSTSGTSTTTAFA